MYGDDGVDVMHNRFLEKFKFMEANYRSLPNKAEDLIERGIVQEKSVKKYKEKTLKAEKRLAKKNPTLTGYEISNLTNDPVLSLYDPKRHIGAISEMMETKLNQYVDKELNEKHNVLDAISASKKPKMKFAPVDIEDFKKMYYYKY
jgi:DNA-directed RNA polymerase I subunit RPA1